MKPQPFDTWLTLMSFPGALEAGRSTKSKLEEFEMLTLGDTRGSLHHWLHEQPNGHHTFAKSYPKCSAYPILNMDVARHKPVASLRAF